MLSFTTLKALHLIAMVAWFSGTFYIVRLFIYHKEAEKRDMAERSVLQKQYKVMIKRLWYMITWPAFVLLFVFGFWMLGSDPSLMKMPYMHIKLGLLVVLAIYHFVNQRICSRSLNAKLEMKSFTLRLWNEVATLLLVSIVFVVVVKTSNWTYGFLGVLLFAGGIWLATYIYKRFRQKDQADTIGSTTNEGSSTAVKEPEA